jgi:DHA2 family methylenomycin A resistance protein-like MFS transporter
MPATSSALAVASGGRYRWLTLPILCLAVLIAQIDTAVVNLAVHPIRDAFNASVGEMQWVVDSYNLVYAVLLLTGGLLADLYGRRLVFMIGAAIFAVASLACALAPSVAVLICGRAATGIGAALLIPTSLAIIRVVWRDEAERGRALGIWAACNGLAFAIGPTLGGLLIQLFGWRSIFLLVVPLALAALALSPAAIPESADPKDRHFDAMAQVLGAVALGCVAFAAIQAHTAPAGAIAAAFAALLAFWLFIRIERQKGPSALVPLDIFQIRQFRSAATATAGMTFGMYGAVFLLPLTWQSMGQLSPTAAGLALMPMALVFVLVSSFSGALSKMLGARFMTGGGVGIIGCGLVLIGLSAGQATLLLAEIGLTFTGFGMGLATGPLMGAAVGAVKAARSGTASALINVARMTGATVGVAVMGAAFALGHGGSQGLLVAMLIGGIVQIGCAAFAWRSI